MIPKVIHYCWFGGNELNELSKKCIESWKKYCPDYEIVEWNENNFDVNCNPYVKEAYEAKKYAFVTDYVRLYVLKEYGGIYMDTDVELLKSPDSFLIHPAFSGFESECDIPTAIMGAEKDNEWINYLLTYYDGRHFINADGSYDDTTNVITITEMTKSKYNVELDNQYLEVEKCFVIYPKDYFCPKDYVTERIKLTDNTVAIHHYSASWLSEKSREEAEWFRKCSLKYENDTNKIQKAFLRKDRLIVLKYSLKDDGLMKTIKFCYQCILDRFNKS